MDASRDLKKRAMLFAGLLGAALLVGLVLFVLRPRDDAPAMRADSNAGDDFAPVAAAPTPDRLENELGDLPRRDTPTLPNRAVGERAGGVSGAVSASAAAAGVRPVEQDGRTYFLMEFALTPAATLIGEDLAEMGGRRARMAEVSDGGQFEILIPVANFPIPAPDCDEYIIVRMPWTDPDLADAERSVADKRALYQRIHAMRAAGEGEVGVLLELNPYVEVVSEDPLQLQLTQCNVFFRQYDGAYAPETMAARQE